MNIQNNFNFWNNKRKVKKRGSCLCVRVVSKLNICFLCFIISAAEQNEDEEGGAFFVSFYLFIYHLFGYFFYLFIYLFSSEREANE
jgi:hypothetical protein